jgi:ferredoxin
MPYKNIVIYFLSGTGNSFRIATCLGKAAKAKRIKTKVLSVDNAPSEKGMKSPKTSLLGLVFPTHGFTAPWHMIKFACRLPRGKKTNAFCATTRAGLKFGKVFVPGISGTAPFIIASILFVKGYRVRGTVSIDMPSNWYSLHPIQREKNLRAIISRGERKAEKFFSKITKGQRVWTTLNNLYEIIWGLLLLPISLGYLLFGRFFLAKLFFANTHCNGCGICAENCLFGAISMRGKQNPRPFWKYNCESCMRCAAFCPKNAIEAGHSWAIILYYISAIPVSIYLFNWLDNYIPGIWQFEVGLTGEILSVFYFYPSIFISYFIFHLFLKIPFVNKLFTYTTFTHIWGRYREPDTKLKQISLRK